MFASCFYFWGCIDVVILSQLLVLHRLYLKMKLTVGARCMTSTCVASSSILTMVSHLTDNGKGHRRLYCENCWGTKQLLILKGVEILLAMFDMSESAAVRLKKTISVIAY